MDLRIFKIAGVVPCLALAFSATALAGPASRAEALHVLDRISYGPRPGDIDRVMQIGVERYIDEQLHPDTIPMPEPLSRRMDALSQGEMSQADLITTYRRVIASTN